MRAQRRCRRLDRRSFDPEARRLLIEQAGDRRFADHLPLVDDRDAIADLLHLAEQMAGEEDGLAAIGGQTADQLAHFLDAGDVEAVHRLVQDHDFRIVEQSGGDAEPLAHAGGIGLHLAPGVPGKADLIEQGVDPLRPAAMSLRQHLQVPASGKEGIESAAVDQRADPPEQGRLGGEVAAEQGNPARARRDQADQHADRRTLAGAIGPEEAIDFACAHGDRNAAHRVHAAAAPAVGLAEVGEGQHRSRIIAALVHAYVHQCIR